MEGPEGACNSGREAKPIERLEDADFGFLGLGFMMVGVVRDELVGVTRGEKRGE